MKSKILILASVLALLGLFWSCETKIDEDWTGFGTSAHFPEPHQYDHVGYIAANPGTLSGCQECHGADYDGGTSGVSCVSCHESLSVESLCNRCHGDPEGDPDDPLNQIPQGEEQENHAAHLTGGEHSKPVDCSACHIVPSSWQSEGHIDDPPTEIVFSGLAVRFGATPVWDDEEETCSGTYCHGEATPEWGEDEAECGSCHGLPPPTPHYLATLNQCVWCHGSVVNAEGEIINSDLHINGAVNN